MDNKIPITIMFKPEDTIGVISIDDDNLDRMTQMLASATTVFSGCYRVNPDGGLTLISLALVPVELKSNLSLLDPENQHGMLKS